MSQKNIMKTGNSYGIKTEYEPSKREYMKYEFCKAVRCCNLNKDGGCNTEPSKCLMTAKEFHHWLKDNRFQIKKKD